MNTMAFDHREWHSVVMMTYFNKKLAVPSPLPPLFYPLQPLSSLALPPT
jgi:hypothetical protein